MNDRLAVQIVPTMRRFQAQFDKTKAKRTLLVFMTTGPLVDVA
jgi:hypothetical protein